MRSVKHNIATIILLFVNFLFAYKYMSRISNLAWLLAVGLLTAQLLMYFYQDKTCLSNHILIKGILITTVFFWFGVLIYSHIKVPILSLNVDRWSVITSFTDACLHGDYPYYAKSHSGNLPGPMPFYFLLAFPFYLTGELGLFSIAGYALAIGWILMHKDKIPQIGFLAFFLLTSIFAIWEIAVRSNIFTNAILVLGLFIYIENWDFRFSWKFIILALLTGFLLSTRSVFILVYLIWFLPYVWRKELPFIRLCGFIFIAVIGFGLTFLPLILAFPKDFFLMNPFIIESTFLVPRAYTMIFIVLACCCTFFVKKPEDRYFYGGLNLFMAIGIYFCYHIAKEGLQQAYFGNVVDISYFILCVPFLLCYMTKFTTQ